MSDVSPPTSPHRATDDQEVVYYEGSPKLRGELGQFSLCVLIGAGLILSPAFLPVDLPPWAWLLAFAAGFVLLAFPFLLVRTTRYRITNYRIDYEHGILTKRLDTLELWHVADIQLRQSILNRMLRVGTISILSNDDTTPKLDLLAIPNPRPLFEALKQRIIAVKRQRGVLKMDIG